LPFDHNTEKEPCRRAMEVRRERRQGKGTRSELRKQKDLVAKAEVVSFRDFRDAASTYYSKSKKTGVLAAHRVIVDFVPTLLARYKVLLLQFRKLSC
jgi:hypothetical protein